MMPSLIAYHLMSGNPPPLTGQMLDYVVAGNGVFVRGRRPGLTACIPVAWGELRGLQPLWPEIHLIHPRVPATAVSQMLARARTAQHDHQPVEILFHLDWRATGWGGAIPPQIQGPAMCAPLETGPDSSFATALIEVHSHHRMGAFWSATDNADESTGFRLYGVLGDIFRRPTLRVRVGLHGYFWEIPASQIFELPAGVYDSAAPTDDEEDPHG